MSDLLLEIVYYYYYYYHHHHHHPAGSINPKLNIANTRARQEMQFWATPSLSHSHTQNPVSGYTQVSPPTPYRYPFLISPVLIQRPIHLTLLQLTTITLSRSVTCSTSLPITNTTNTVHFILSGIQTFSQHLLWNSCNLFFSPSRQKKTLLFSPVIGGREEAKTNLSDVMG